SDNVDVGPFIHIMFIYPNGNPLVRGFTQFFAFYPTDNGTVIKQVYNSTILPPDLTHYTGYVDIPLSVIMKPAEEWFKHYNEKITPSLIGFISYGKTINTTEIEFYSQEFTIPYNPINILKGTGKTQIIVLNQLTKRIIKTTSKNNLKEPQQTFITTTTVPWYYCSENCYLVYYIHDVYYYPNQNGVAPISVAEFNATQFQNWSNYMVNYDGMLGIGIASILSSNLNIDFEITSVIPKTSGAEFEYQIAGSSIQLSQGEMSESLGLKILYTPTNYLGMIYVMGQLAIVNYSVYSYYGNVFVGYQANVFETALVLQDNSGAYAPVLNETANQLVEGMGNINFTKLVLASEINPGGSYYVNFISIESNEIPLLGATIPVGEIIITATTILGLIDPPLWVIDLMLLASPSIAITYTASSTMLWSTTFSLDVSQSAPAPALVYFENSTVPYLMNGREYALPLPVFYIVPSSSGGCVLYGTEITLYDGSEIPVQYLHVGDEVLSYDTVLHRFVKSHVVSISVSKVSGIIDINNGFLYLSGWDDQSVFVLLRNGTEKWIVLKDLKNGMKLFDPIDNKWIEIINISIRTGSYKVYDIKTDNVNNYIANRILIDVKSLNASSQNNVK
ncbi:MAG: Hint domain-containing protein, partial [Thermoprotei archaeon]